MAASSPATTPPADLAPPEEPRLPHRVTIIGGGFAGLYAARNLGIDPEVRVTLIDRRNFHLFQPMLYQVATGALSPGDIAQPLRSILRQAPQHDGHPRRGRRHRRREAPGPAVGRRPGRLRHAHRRDRRAPQLLRPPGVGAPRAGPQDRRGRDRDPPPDPHRLRGRRARGRPGTAERVDDVRDRRRRPDRRRARRRARRDRPRHAQARLPGDPSRRTRRSSSSRRWTASCRRIRPGGRRRPSASSSGSASRSGLKTRVIDIDERQRPRRHARRHRGDDPDPDRPVGRRRPGVVVRAEGGDGRPGRRPTGPGGSSSSPT